MTYGEQLAELAGLFGWSPRELDELEPWEVERWLEHAARLVTRRRRAAST